MSDPLSFEADEPEVAAAPAEPASFEVDPPSFELDAPEAIPEVAAEPLHETKATLNVGAPAPVQQDVMGLGVPPPVKVPFQPLFDVAQSFKKQHIDPIIRGAQLWGKIQYNQMGGGKLREVSPALAMGVENLAKPYIGETELNQPGSQSPEALKAINSVESSIDQFLPGWGAGISAAYQSGTQNLGNLPMYLIPGIGANPAIAGMTGNVASALLEPDADLKEAAVTGLVGGKAAELAVKGAAKGLQAAKSALAKPGKKLTVPIAAVPPEQVDEFARKVMDEVQDSTAVIRSKAGSADASGYVVDIQDGVPVTKSLKITPQEVTTQTLAAGTAPPKGATVILTPEAQAVLNNNPVSSMAHDFWRPGAVLDNAKIMDISDWDASRNPGVKEGLVLAIEGGGGDGTARLHQIDSPSLQREILKSRGLAEVTLPNGEKRVGFLAPGDEYGGLIRPDADEFIPNALETDLAFTPEMRKKARLIESNSELDDILLQRERLRGDFEEAQIRAKADAEASAADVQMGGNGSGNGLPPPPGHLPPDGPPPPPNPKRDALDPTQPVALQWWDKVARAGTSLKNKWLNPTVRGPQDLFDLSKMAHSVDTFEQLKAPIFKQLTNAAPELAQMAPAQHRQALDDINRFVSGHTSLEQLRAKQPALSASFYRQLEMRKIQQLADERQLQNLGMLTPDQTLAEVIGADIADSPEFMNRVFMRSLLPAGEWKAIASRDRVGMNAIRDAIVQDIYTHVPGKKSTEQYRFMSQEQRKVLAERHLDFLLGDAEKIAQARKDPQSAWASVVREAGGSLRKSKDLRWWEKAAMGEIDSPFIRIAESQARQKAMILRGSMWREVALNPKLAVHKELIGPEHVNWVELPNRPNEFGKAAGMMVSPEVEEALISTPLAQKNAASLPGKFVNAIKYGQTIGNPGSWVTNFFANGQNALLSNLVDPFSGPVKIGKGMGRFFDDMAAHKKGIGLAAEEGNNVAVQRFNRMMELGVVGSDFATHEFQEGARTWQRIVEDERVLTGGQLNAHEMFVRLAKGASQGKEKITKLYSNIDAMWKYSTALAGLEKGGIDLTTGKLNKAKAINFIDKRYRPGMDEAALKEQVELEVAHRIHLSFPMLDRIGTAPAKLGQTAGVLTNPYVKMWAETGRNYAQLPQRILMEKGMAAQMLKVSAIAGTLYAANKGLQQAMGMNQQEIDRTFATAPEAVRRFKPGAMVLPFRTAEGRLTLIDLTRFFEPFTYLTGNPETAAPVRMLQNLLTNPISGGLAEPLLNEMLSRAGLVDPAYRPPETPEWRRDLSGALVDTAGRILPAALRNTYNTLERGNIGFAPKGFRGPPTVPQSGAVTAANLLLGPNRFQEIGGEVEKDRALYRREMEVAQAKKEAKQVSRMNEGQSTGPLTAPLNKAEALKKAREIATDKKKQYLDFRDKLGE